MDIDSEIRRRREAAARVQRENDATQDRANASLDSKMDAFLRDFADAVDFLRREGVPELRVCQTHTQPLLVDPTMKRVYPFSVIAVRGSTFFGDHDDGPGLFLHDGALYLGTAGRSRAPSLRHGITKKTLVVDAHGTTGLESAADMFTLAPSGGHRPAGELMITWTDLTNDRIEQSLIS